MYIEESKNDENRIIHYSRQAWATFHWDGRTKEENMIEVTMASSCWIVGFIPPQRHVLIHHERYGSGSTIPLAAVTKANELIQYQDSSLKGNTFEQPRTITSVNKDILDCDCRTVFSFWSNAKFCAVKVSFIPFTGKWMVRVSIGTKLVQYFTKTLASSFLGDNGRPFKKFRHVTRLTFFLNCFS